MLGTNTLGEIGFGENGAAAQEAAFTPSARVAVVLQEKRRVISIGELRAAHTVPYATGRHVTVPIETRSLIAAH